MVWHFGIDFAGQLDEARVKVPFLGFPRKVKWIDWNAMASESRSRIERMESKGLCGGSLDYFPNINTHSQAKQLEFIHQRDVDAAINVFEQLRHLRNCRRRHRDRAIKNGAVNSARKLGRLRFQSPHNLRDVATGDCLVPRILALRRESHEKAFVFCISIACGF